MKNLFARLLASLGGRLLALAARLEDKETPTGCLHEDTENLSTFGTPLFRCPDCGAESDSLPL